jgi:hypothetical protein
VQIFECTAAQRFGSFVHLRSGRARTRVPGGLQTKTQKQQKQTGEKEEIV